MRVSYACVATAALAVAAIGAGTHLGSRNENPPQAAASSAEHDVSDQIEAPESHTAGFSEVAKRFAESAIAEASVRSASVYSATTMEELAEKGRAAREALIRSAIASGLNVDLSRFPDAAAMSSIGEFIWPVANARISDHFGARGGQHAGMDLAAAGGTPITAASPGIVVLSSESHYGYGVAVIIQHINGVQTLYGHMTHGSRAVKEGDWVEAGDPIGLVGNTGHSFGDHLHFEVRVNGTAVDPRRYLDGAGDPVVVAPWTPITGGTPAQVPEPPKPEQPAKPTSTPSGKPTPTPTPTPTGTPTPTPTPTDPPGTPTPTPDPTPTDPPATPTPTNPPGTPTPDPDPTPTDPPSTPEPTDPPAAPEPTQAPSAPEPTAPPAAPEPPAPPAPTQEPSEPPSTPEPSTSAAPE